MIDPELMQLECRLRLIEHIDATPPPAEPLDLWVEGFWAAIEAISVPRTQTELETLIEMRQTVHARQQEMRHANHRPRTSADAPARRKSDAPDPTLAADVEAQARLARDRDRAQRAVAHQHSDEVK